MIRIKNVLISVSDKTGLEIFAKGLSELGIGIISTGGTGKFLEEKGIKIKYVEDVTSFPEILEGRVKTLHPKVFGGILASKDNKKHIKDLEDSNIELIDMVVVNFYPFDEAVKKGSYKLDEIIEFIDIGGPSLLRAAAKNYKFTVPVSDHSDYEYVLKSLETNSNKFSVTDSFNFAKKVFEKTARYDSIIYEYFEDDKLPYHKIINLKKVQDLRYGENPHQKAAFYRCAESDVKWVQLHGKELSYNNISDLDSAIKLVQEFDEPVCGIIKHANPCGVGKGEDDITALRNALKTDPVSSFGGIFSFNSNVSLESAEVLSSIFFEVITAPSFDENALEMLKKKKNLRIVKFDREEIEQKVELEYKSVKGGCLVQERDKNFTDKSEWKCVTEKKPTEGYMKKMEFAWKVVKYVKSNAVIFCDDKMALGIGAGQMSRVDSCKIAVMKAKQQNLDLKGSVVASDAFFPFRDGLDEVAKAGAVAVIQPGGSIRDKEVIQAANEHNICMVFTGKRHFRH